METKIGTSYQFRSSFGGGKSVSSRRNVYTNSAKTQSTNADTFTRSYSDSSGEIENNSTCFYLEHREELEKFTENAKKAVRLEPLNAADDNYEIQIKFNFGLIGSFEKRINENISKNWRKQAFQRT